MDGARRVVDRIKPEPITDTAPCVGCGLCCDGTMYSKAKAEPHEEERLTQAGLVVFEDEGKRWFAHPCRFSKEGLCTIYGQERFEICHSFRCKLLKAYQAGEIGREDALQRVQQALATRKKITDEEPSAGRLSQRNLMRLELEKTKERPELLLKLAAFDYYLDKWFR